MKDIFKNLKSYQDPVYWDTEEKKLKWMKISETDRQSLIVIVSIASGIAVGLLYALVCTILGVVQ